MVLTRMVFNAPADNSRYSTLNTDRNPKLKPKPYFYYFCANKTPFQPEVSILRFTFVLLFPEGHQ